MGYPSAPPSPQLRPATYGCVTATSHPCFDTWTGRLWVLGTRRLQVKPSKTTTNHEVPIATAHMPLP